MEPEPKKRKLDHAWFISSVQELDVSDLAKQGMAETLSQIPEDVLQKDPPEKLMFYLQADVALPDLEELKVNKLLDVAGFTKLLASNTEATRPIFLRKHLRDVHQVAVDVLSASVQKDAKRLVSLVGCPGTGKTWCGWLVAHALQKAGRGTLHVTIRGNEVIVVSQFKKKKTYEIADWNYFMLKQVLNENQCDVCIIDVGNKRPIQTHEIFQGVRTILESSAEPKPFPKVKFMGLVSGHAQENIIGKDRNIDAQKLVLWSWSEDDFQAYVEAAKGSAHTLKEDVYDICGGSVRLWFKPEQDESNISEDVGQLQDDFKRGVVSAYIVPRSEYVIRSIRAHKKGSFSQFKKMYEVLVPLNPGAAGTPFEILVHYFWEECINEKGNIQLTLTDKDGKVQTTISVNCADLRPVAECDPVESWDDKDAVDTNLFGYFTPDNKSNYPRLDSILRYKIADQTRVLAIQVSIGKDHTQGDKPNNALLQEKLKKGEKTKLALWDHRHKGRKCVWKSHASEDWELVYVRCREFDDKMRHS
ncbi:Klp61F [Symbiodinium microadriaticum]|nr:Klp61F [Symbiodinium microadriaticum]CAE7854084.1 Klp61F [Symbiodinium sp. KB8]